MHNIILRTILYVLLIINIGGSLYIYNTATLISQRADAMKEDIPKYLVRERIASLRYGIRMMASRIPSDCWYKYNKKVDPDFDMKGEPLEVRLIDGNVAIAGWMNEDDFTPIDRKEITE